MRQDGLPVAAIRTAEEYRREVDRIAAGVQQAGVAIAESKGGDAKLHAARSLKRGLKNSPWMRDPGDAISVLYHSNNWRVADETPRESVDDVAPTILWFAYCAFERDVAMAAGLVEAIASVEEDDIDAVDGDLF